MFDAQKSLQERKSHTVVTPYVHPNRLFESAGHMQRIPVCSTRALWLWRCRQTAAPQMLRDLSSSLYCFH
jgi:hypothetical protein